MSGGRAGAALLAGPALRGPPSLASCRSRPASSTPCSSCVLGECAWHRRRAQGSADGGRDGRRRLAGRPAARNKAGLPLLVSAGGQSLLTLRRRAAAGAAACTRGRRAAAAPVPRCSAAGPPRGSAPLATLVELHGRVKQLLAALSESLAGGGAGRSGAALQTVLPWQGVGALRLAADRPPPRLAAAWEAQRRWLQYSLARVALGAGLLLVASTVWANAWGVPALNTRLLPQAQQLAARVLQREVEVGSVHWLSPVGLTGLTPLASLGPVSVGPAPHEQSSLTAERVTVGVDPLRSLAQRRVVLTTKLNRAEVRVGCRRSGVPAPVTAAPPLMRSPLPPAHPQVDLVQGSNFSWFGYPDDTQPSARNFLPGLSSLGSGGSSSQGGGGGSSSGGGEGGGGAASSSGRSAPTSAASSGGADQGRPVQAASSKQRDAGPAASSTAAVQMQHLLDALLQHAWLQAGQHVDLGAAAEHAAFDPGLGALLLDGAREALQPVSMHHHFADAGGQGPSSSRRGSDMQHAAGAAPHTQGAELDHMDGRAGLVGGGRAGASQQQLAALNALPALQRGVQQAVQAAGALSAHPAMSSIAHSASVAQPPAQQPGVQPSLAPCAAEHQLQPEPGSQNADLQRAAAPLKAQGWLGGPGAAPSSSSSSTPGGNKPEPARGGGPGSGSPAAILNSTLQPVVAPSAKLFTAHRHSSPPSKPVVHSLQDVAARTAAAAAAEASQQEEGELAAQAADASAAQEAPPSSGSSSSSWVPPAAPSAFVQRVNALPTLTASWSSARQQVAGVAQQHGEEAAPAASVLGDGMEAAAQAAPPPQSPAARRVNALPLAEAPSHCRPEAAVSGERRLAFAVAVVDPSTLRKKGECSLRGACATSRSSHRLYEESSKC